MSAYDESPSQMEQDIDSLRQQLQQAHRQIERLEPGPLPPTEREELKGKIAFLEEVLRDAHRKIERLVEAKGPDLEAHDWQERAEQAETALSKINDIRNSIIGTQNINWSAHIYPLVAALNEAGVEGLGYEKASRMMGELLHEIENNRKVVAAAREVEGDWKELRAALTALDEPEEESHDR